MRYWGNSDTGVARMENQDAYILRRFEGGWALLLVCDGMGGVQGGKIASDTASRVFARTVEQKLAAGLGADQMPDIVTAAAQAANQAVYQAAGLDGSLAGMGTTLVCLLTDGQNAVIGNIGDSRAYLATEEGLRQVTHDHSLVAEMARRGEISWREANSHPDKNVITRALGVDSDVACDVFPLKMEAGQYILLCSDGLTNEVSDPELYYEIFQSQAPERACDTLIDIANRRGGRDNITVLLAAF